MQSLLAWYDCTLVVPHTVLVSYSLLNDNIIIVGKTGKMDMQVEVWQREIVTVESGEGSE